MATNNNTKNNKVQEPAQPQVVVQDDKLAAVLRRKNQQASKKIKSGLTTKDLDMITYNPHISKFRIPDEIQQKAAEEGFALCWVDDDEGSLAEYESLDWLFCTREKCSWIPDKHFDENGLITMRARQTHYLHFQSKNLNIQVKERQSNCWEDTKQENKNKVENDDRLIKGVSSGDGIDPIMVDHDGNKIDSVNDLETDFTA